jgi:hypothetical protein
VADEHYRDVDDSDFDKATAGSSEQAAQNPAQSTPNKAGQPQTSENEPSENGSENPANRELSETAVGGELSTLGLEPRTYGLKVRCSTN